MKPAWPVLFALFVVLPGLSAFAVSAGPERWGRRGLNLIAAALYATIMGAFVAVLTSDPSSPAPWVYVLLGIVMAGWSFGPAFWLGRWRARRPPGQEYLVQAVHAYLGGVVGMTLAMMAAIGGMVAMTMLFGWSPTGVP